MIHMSQVLSGHDDIWQTQHVAWCYVMALWGQISFMTSTGYTVIAIVNILLLLGKRQNTEVITSHAKIILYDITATKGFSTYYTMCQYGCWRYSVVFRQQLLGRQVPILTLGCPVDGDMTPGWNEHGTCWFTGPYHWSAGGFMIGFLLFVLASIVYFIAILGTETHQRATVMETHHSYQVDTYPRQQLHLSCISLFLLLWDLFSLGYGIGPCGCGG